MIFFDIKHLCLLIITFWLAYENQILILISEMPASSTFHLDKHKYCLIFPCKAFIALVFTKQNVS